MRLFKFGAYHAWNEVYLNNDRITIDVTRDASLLASGDSFKRSKDSVDYTKVYEY